MSPKDPSSRQDKELEFLEKMRNNQQLPEDKSIDKKDRDNRMQRKEDLNSIADYENQRMNKKEKLNPKINKEIEKDVTGLEKSVKKLGTFDHEPEGKYPASSEKLKKIEKANEKAKIENQERRKQKHEIKKKGR